jgi:hypothetical protein
MILCTKLRKLVTLSKGSRVVIKRPLNKKLKKSIPLKLCEPSSGTEISIFLDNKVIKGL